METLETVVHCVCMYSDGCGSRFSNSTESVVPRTAEAIAGREASEAEKYGTLFPFCVSHSFLLTVL